MYEAVMVSANNATQQIHILVLLSRDDILQKLSLLKL